MPGTKNTLGEYLKRVMKKKGLTQKDVQRISGGRITGGYVASITAGRARNLSVDKLKALADGIGVDVVELFHIARAQSEDLDRRGKGGYAPDALMVLETVQKVLSSPDITAILDEVVGLSPEERVSLRAFIKRLGAFSRRSRRKTNPD